MTLQEIIAALGQTWPARMGHDILQGALAPGRAMQGQFGQPGSREFTSAAVEPMANLAGIPMLATTGAPIGALGVGPAAGLKLTWGKIAEELDKLPPGTVPSLTTPGPVTPPKPKATLGNVIDSIKAMTEAAKAQQAEKLLAGMPSPPTKSVAGVTLPTQPIVPLKTTSNNPPAYKDFDDILAKDDPENIIQTLAIFKEGGQMNEFHQLIGSIPKWKWDQQIQPLLPKGWWDFNNTTPLTAGPTVVKPKPQLIMSPEEEAYFASIAGAKPYQAWPDPQWTYGLEQHRIENPASLAERTARAQAQGQAGPTYHGSSDFEGGHLKPHAYGGAFRFWHTPSPKLAGMYAGVESDYIRPGAALLPLVFRAPEYHIFDAKGKTWDTQFTLPTKGEFAEIINPEKALTGDVNRAALLEALEAKKTGGVVIKNVWDEPASDMYNPGILGSPQTTVITTDPSTLRSVYAQFDPAKLHYNDLLAGLGGFGAAGAGLAALAPRGAEAKAVEGSSEPMFVPAMKEGIEYRRNLEEKKPRRPRTFQEEWENIMDELLRGTIPTAPWPGGLARAR